MSSLGAKTVRVLNKDLEQIASGGSTAIQAGGNVTVGLSFSEVRAAALDVFNANFYRLAGAAEQTARIRAEEITEEFLSKLQNENPKGLEESSDPDFRYALFTVQKEYARTGDKDLGDLLVDLLVDRSKQSQRDLVRIVLNESLNTAPKLTDNQLAVLAVVFLFKHTQNFQIVTHQRFGEYLDANVKPFASKLLVSEACYQHLEFTACASTSVVVSRLEEILAETYQGLFLKGFSATDVTGKAVSIGMDPRFFAVCLNDASKIQVRAKNKEVLRQAFDSYAISEEDRNKILELFDSSKMSNDEIRGKCISVRPYMKELFEAWTGSRLGRLMLSSVGIAIGHANVKRLVGEFADLSIWIN